MINNNNLSVSLTHTRTHIALQFHFVLIGLPRIHAADRFSVDVISNFSVASSYGWDHLILQSGS